MPNEKFIMQHKTSAPKGRKREYPHIRISMPAYAHVCEIADETGRTITDVASKAIEYAYANLVYGVTAETEAEAEFEAESGGFAAPLSDEEVATDNPAVVKLVNDIIHRAGLRRFELALLLSTVQLLPDCTE